MFLWNKCQYVQWMLGTLLICKEPISQKSFITFSIIFSKTGEIWVFSPELGVVASLSDVILPGNQVICHRVLIHTIFND